MSAPPLLDITGLEVGFEGQAAPVLEGLDLRIAPGEAVALVGESGSGKSMTALSLMRLLPTGARMRAGSMRFDGQDVMAMSPARLNRLRGGEIGMLFQQPHAMLDPTATVGSQVAEAVRRHSNLGRAAAWARVIELFRDVGIPAPETRARSYAHQMSGGMAQRVMIAAALAGNPRLLIADEPTTALDVTVQLQILQLLARERQTRRLSTLLISHDLAVVSAFADRILVMYAGRVVEEGTARTILERPLHPYTQALVRASLLRAGQGGALFALKPNATHGEGCRFLPRCATAEAHGLHDECAGHEPKLLEHAADHRVRCCAPGRILEHAEPAPPTLTHRPMRPDLVALRDVSKHYHLGLLGRGVVRSVDRVSLEIREGEILGLVGESGCGKSTLARLLLRMTGSDGGGIQAVGHDYATVQRRDLHALRRDTQLVFQDPFGALDPSMTLGDSLRAVLAQNRIGTKATREASIAAMLDEVGLDLAFLERLPGECSGGQLQRAVIARALLLGPKFLVCDEPTSALDASVRAQILNLLARLRATHDLAILMISHDLRVVRHLCDRVAVMYLGEIVEIAETETLFRAPAHPYTQALIAASLLEEHGLQAASGMLRGEPPSPLNPPTGCRFHTRCDLAEAACAREHPVLEPASAAHAVRCLRWETAQAAASTL